MIQQSNQLMNKYTYADTLAIQDLSFIYPSIHRVLLKLMQDSELLISTKKDK